MGVVLYRVVFLLFIKNHRQEQARYMRFLQVRIPKKPPAKSGEEVDNINNMKENINVMNQVYKNFYAIFESGWKYKNF